MRKRRPPVRPRSFRKSPERWFRSRMWICTELGDALLSSPIASISLLNFAIFSNFLVSSFSKCLSFHRQNVSLTKFRHMSLFKFCALCYLNSLSLALSWLLNISIFSQAAYLILCIVLGILVFMNLVKYLFPRKRIEDLVS